MAEKNVVINISYDAENWEQIESSLDEMVEWDIIKDYEII